MSENALYRGITWHKRHQPKVHTFQYALHLFWLNLHELETLPRGRLFSTATGSLLRFRRRDYLQNAEQPLWQEALQTMSGLAGKALDGKVYLLGQVRWMGLYFSPVNFYFLQSENGDFTHMLAEVSNTPWNQRHCYLVDLKLQADSQKVFHVSPFNPMDMAYQWSIAQPGEHLSLCIRCKRQETEFEAGLKMTKIPLNSNSLFRVLLSTLTLKTLFGIYWQALRLFIKGTPIHSHPTGK